MGKLINIDNGGTLTDIWVLDGEHSYHTKTITTPYDLSRCFYEGLKKVSGVIYGEDDIPALLHSTDQVGQVVDLIELMNRDFGERYGQNIVSPESGVWVSTLRVVSWIDLPALKFEEMTPPEDKIAAPDPVEYRDCHFVGREDAFETPVYDAAALQPGIVIEGPAIVNPGSTTCLVEPGWRFESAEQGAVWFLKQNNS